ncbi:MAG: SpoIVB peptidase S55 domain-containing protein [Terracidiphilus sp.]|nr:SpoIVB peptidase S55 domain-containing protein [Terracidiphilus sp.]
MCSEPGSALQSKTEIYPLSQVHAGLRATAWTVFRGTQPEAMDVEILGVLRGALGPEQDMILAQLHGAKPEYTGVVAGMSGSPVYVDGKLLGALSYRIGQFARDPIAGITPIEQMLAVRDLPQTASGGAAVSAGGMSLQPMETPLTMSGFGSEAIRYWQQQMAGTGLENVGAGGAGSSAGTSNKAEVAPGAAVSAQLVRGDLEIAASCTVTYVDPKQLLACGHPLFQFGTISMPMTATEVVATLASPLNAFKIVNTGAEIGAFTEDRNAAIRGELGARAHMIPMLVTVDGGVRPRQVKVEILDQPSLTDQAAQVVLLQALMASVDNSAAASYHVTGTVEVEGFPAFPVDLWGAPADAMPATISAAVQLGEWIKPIYANSTRSGALRKIDLHVETLPRRAQLELVSARLMGSNVVHAGEKVQVEATLQPWQQPEQKIILEVQLPAWLPEGSVRLLVSDAGTLDRALKPPQGPAQRANLNSVLSESRERHPADRLYASLLMPAAQATVDGQTLQNLPLSMTNALEPLRGKPDTALNGESAEVLEQKEAGGSIAGFSVLHIRIERGAGLK